MNLRDAIHAAIDALPGDAGAVSVDVDGQRAEVDVVDHDRLGVRIGGVRITHDAPRDVRAEAERLAGERGLPDALTPTEIDARLGGAILRSEPENREFTEVELRPDTTTLRRWRAVPGAAREPVDLELSRKQLGRLIDSLG